MKLEIKESKNLLPQLYVGQPTIFKIVMNEKHHDTILESERNGKNGNFKQYELFLMNEQKENVSAVYLFLNQLTKLHNEVSQDSEDWANTFVEISGSPREVGSTTYYDLQIKPCSSPEWSHEIVK